jgi:predicted AlkP superfamily pyrophosphatase or phosphodiesterase
MKTRYPDYDNSIVNLACSVLKYYGVPDVRHLSLEDVDAVLASRRPRNVVVMLFDAMGISILERHLPADSFTRRHLLRPITSVFPSTTMAATTAIYTGLTPLETGWLGWITYFKEVDANVVTIYNTLQGTHTPACDRHLAFSVMPYRSLAMQIRDVDPEVRCTAISPFAINATDRTTVSHSVSESCELIAEAVKNEGKNFVISYWESPDDLMHKYGVDDPDHVAPAMRDIDANLERLSAMLGEDTVVLVTADHSQLNSKWDFLSDYPDLRELLVRDHSMDSRAASLFVREGKKEEFRRRFEERLGGHYQLMDHDEFLASGLLGNGTPHPRTDGFVGDFVAVATGEYSLDDERTDHPMIGMHAGIAEEEMMVPLIVL